MSTNCGADGGFIHLQSGSPRRLPKPLLRETHMRPCCPFRAMDFPCFAVNAFAKREKCCILPAREALSAVSRQKHRTKRKNKQIHPVRVVIPMTLCSEDDVGVPTSSSMTLLGQFSAKTCSEEDVSTLTSSSATHTSQSPVNLCSEDNVSTSTSSSVTLLGQIFVKTCGEDNVSKPTSSSATHPRQIPVNLFSEEDVSTPTSSSREILRQNSEEKMQRGQRGQSYVVLGVSCHGCPNRSGMTRNTLGIA